MQRFIKGLLCLLVSFQTFSSITYAKTLKIQLITWRGITPAEEGFKEQLKTLGYKVEYQHYDANQVRADVSKFLRDNKGKLQSDFDYIYTFGTTLSKMTKKLLSNKTPHIFNIVTSPVDAGLVDSMEKPGGNISGTTNISKLSTQVENALKILKFKKLGIIYNPQEKNSKICKSTLTDLGKAHSFSVTGIRLPPNKNDLSKNLNKAISKNKDIDAMFIPSDSFIAANAGAVLDKLNTEKITTIGAIEKLIKAGALLGTVTDYKTLGKLTADIIHRHQKGEKLGEIPVQKQGQAKIVVNKKTMQQLGSKIPAEFANKVDYIE
ncbi:MAG: ABC transporter substrate-binding protein [Oligoflexales bacterium]|nr:ABC transporter substrate-binding protein [Oligoflexales bacterium]